MTILYELRKTRPGYLQTEKRKAVMNVKFGKRLIRRAAIGFSVWKHLTTKLKEYGFSINPYDLCDSNNMFEGKRYTILWDVDDIKYLVSTEK